MSLTDRINRLLDDPIGRFAHDQPLISAIRKELAVEDKRVLFLAESRDTGYGYFWPERPIDGPHAAPEGVARAAATYKRLGINGLPYGPWVMVEVHPLPERNPE